MSLDASIQVSTARMSELLDMLKGYLNAAKGPGVPEFARREITNATVTIASIRSEINAINATMAAGRATGQVERPLVVTDLELHPKQLPAQVEHEKLLASLHRVADHTLDPDENTDGETPHVVTYGGKDS